MNIACVPSPTAFRRSKARSSTSRTTESCRPKLGFTHFLILLLPIVAACGGDGLILPSAGEPARIEILSGNGQVGTVGQTLGAPFVVLVTDPEGRPVQGVEVVFVPLFVPPAGAAVAPNDTVFTGSDGRAAVQYTLATVSGDQTVEARAKPVVPSAPLNVVLHAMAQPDAAISLVLAGGNEQIGETSAALPDSLVVRAVDRFGNGVPGVEVVWEADGGSVSSTSVNTGADGRAAVERILGDRPGAYTTTATAGLEGSPVSFTATGVAPPSPQLTLATQPSREVSAGVPFARQPVVQLQDAAGAPLLRADVTVTVQIASGGGIARRQDNGDEQCRGRGNIQRSGNRWWAGGAHSDLRGQRLYPGNLRRDRCRPGAAGGRQQFGVGAGGRHRRRAYNDHDTAERRVRDHGGGRAG